jgi:site-specific DNA recombinase
MPITRAEYSPRRIARALNSEGIPGPRAGHWTASCLLGSAVRQNGVLRNRLYAGERVWNRQRFDKNPTTGKRVSRPNAPEDVKVIAVPGLRIIEQPLWETVQARLRARRGELLQPETTLGGGDSAMRNKGAMLASVRRPAWLLSGLVKCGICNGPMTVGGKGGRLACANHRERGTCDNRRTGNPVSRYRPSGSIHSVKVAFPAAGELWAPLGIVKYTMRCPRPSEGWSASPGSGFVD